MNDNIFKADAKREIREVLKRYGYYYGNPVANEVLKELLVEYSD